MKGRDKEKRRHTIGKNSEHWSGEKENSLVQGKGKQKCISNICSLENLLKK
jgi:hypothetical protein